MNRWEQLSVESGFEVSQVESMPQSERVLTEVDHLLEARIAPHKFDQGVLDGVGQNLFTAVQEAAMPYAVTRTEHEVVVDLETKRRTFMWLGRTAVQTAMSGYRFHSHENALKRVDVEVAEARHAEETLTVGRAQVFISPRMTRADASLEEARQEHLGDDDAVRISWLEEDNVGNQQRVMQSLLVRDVPFEAWVSMLKSPNNIFGQAIDLEDDSSALSVMQAYEYMELDREALPNGPVSILEEVVKYIDDDTARQRVESQISKYHTDQEELRRRAEFKAEQWLEFEKELAESLYSGRPTSQIKAFIASMQSVWNEDEKKIIDSHLMGEDLNYMMTRELAAVLENMKQNTLWSGAAILAGNKSVTRQFDRKVLTAVQHQENAMYAAYSQGFDFRVLESNSARLIGSANIKVGGGCAGTSNRSSSSEGGVNGLGDALQPDGEVSSGNSDDNWENDPGSRKWKKGICQVSSCSSRPGQTEVGPCSVCKSCQAKFDRGEDPTKAPARPVAKKPAKAVATLEELFKLEATEEARGKVEAAFV